MPLIKRNQTSANLWKSIKPYQSVRHFENAVIQFQYRHKTPIRQLPYVLGKKINLRKLYISVIKKGGYKKVNETEVWDDVLSDINLPKEGTNCELAIQTIYHRYLEAFERDQWNSLNSDSIVNTTSPDIDLSKHATFISDLTIRDRTTLASFVNDITPKIYSDYRHIISNSVRAGAGLSCDLKETAELRHLSMSLKSGLCNEIDFALYTVLIMSNINRISLDFRFTGELLDLIVSTTGIMDLRPGSYFEQFQNCLWMKDSLKFWNRTVENGLGRMFLVPNIFTCSKSEMKQIKRDCNRISRSNDSVLFNDDGRYNPIVDPCCQRIHLVATIIHNLIISSSYNSQTLVNSNQALRFLFLAVHSTDAVLRRLSLQTLTKLRFVLFPIQENPDAGLKTLLYPKELSVDIDPANDQDEDYEEEWFTEFLLDFLMSLISSDNRCERIAAYEMIQSLCLIEDNHETLSKLLQNQFIVKLSSQLLVPDIHPLCGVLEALVSLSQLGDDMCRRMAMCASLLRCLLQFISIEAQMFGPTAVYKIKTFNSRPPIPAVNNHSLRMPMQRPFLNQSSPHILNTSHNLIRPPNYNSISTQCLSKPLVNSPIQHSQNSFQYITNQIQPPNKSQLTPLQQIDHLLMKSIASFTASPSVKLENANSQKCDKNVDEKNIHCEKIEYNEKYNQEEKPSLDDKVVEIKCCVDEDVVENEDLNGVSRLANGVLRSDEVNGIPIIEEQVVTKEELEESPNIDSSSESLSEDKDESYIFQNGTLELDVSDNDDPDRRQMPPPSLPTPSMLKKQMRPKVCSPMSLSSSTNGFLKQQSQCEDRCEQAKKWLKENFQITDDLKLFVVKQQLVDELHEALFDMDETTESLNQGQKIVLSAQELHGCIKEIFGPTVQVKEAQGLNGCTQLIYSHLGRIDSLCTAKRVSNGFVNAIGEINGCVNHATKRKRSNYDGDNEGEGKKFCEQNKEEHVNKKKELKQELQISIPTVTAVVTEKRDHKTYQASKSWNTALKVKRKYRYSKIKSTKICKTPKRSTAANNYVSDTKVTYESASIGRGDLHAYMQCFWGSCSEKFIDARSLHNHITNDHLLVGSTREYCQWRGCPTSKIQRAPLSLLSHVSQEHCTVHYPVSVNNIQSDQSGHNQYSIISQPSLNSAAVTYNQQEKSGWSVIYDHFRIDEQSQPNLPEGPITKHIRISSAIILRNMSRRSIIAKEFLRSHEKYLSFVALSNQDCSSIIVQCLDELSPLPIDHTSLHLLTN